MTLDYFHVDGQPQFIECNPRTIEPGNAACAGVDLPTLTIALSQGRPPPDRPVVGRAGVRTRGALALAVGASERTGSRQAILHVLRDCALRSGEIGGAAEVLTPILRDPLSALPLAAMSSLLLANPRRASAIADTVVEAYRVTPAAVDVVRNR